MGSTKTEFKFFTVPEWKKEERYLREQHKRGWEFVSVNFIGLYHFKRCEPKDVVYQLDYNPESITQKNEYIQMFHDCGWEYLQNFAGYSYFRKPASEMDGEEEIFCDDDSRLEMIKRVFKRRIPPLLCVFFLIIIPQIIMQSFGNTAVNRILLVLFCGFFFVYLILFSVFAMQFWKYYKSVHK